MVRLLELGTNDERRTRQGGFSIATGVVTNNCDLIVQGKVQVRIPGQDQEVWARMCATGGGNNRGLQFTPQINDEVLVAMSQEDPTDAFILGGMWSTTNGPPAANVADLLSKRTLRTGLTEAVGHELEFDDALQSITLTSSTEQQITIDPFKIELKNTAGTLTITLDNTTQTIKISAAGAIELEALQKISLESSQIELKGAKVDIQSFGPCSIQGLPVKIN